MLVRNKVVVSRVHQTVQFTPTAGVAFDGGDDAVILRMKVFGVHTVGGQCFRVISHTPILSPGLPFVKLEFGEQDSFRRGISITGIVLQR